MQAVRDEKFDLVLLDVNMPGIGGMETCRLIRANSETAIIMLKVRNAEQDKVAALDAGADDYVTKPFGMPELLARIRAALRRLPAPADGASGMVKLPDFDVNLTARRVVVQGKHGSPDAEGVRPASVFSNQPERAADSRPITAGRLGPDYGNEVEYLRVFVNQLRKKIEPNPSKPRYILTEPWLGYLFEITGAGDSSQSSL